MQMLVQIRMLLIWNHVLPLLLLLFVQWSRSDLADLGSLTSCAVVALRNCSSICWRFATHSSASTVLPRFRLRRSTTSTSRKTIFELQIYSP